MKALREALKGPETWKGVLRAQIPGLRVVSREGTGAGGYINLSLGDGYPLARIGPEEKGYPPVVDVTHPDIPYGGAFMVWTEEGRISLLEYYSNGGESWPERAAVDSFTFKT